MELLYLFAKLLSQDGSQKFWKFGELGDDVSCDAHEGAEGGIGDDVLEVLGLGGVFALL